MSTFLKYFLTKVNMAWISPQSLSFHSNSNTKTLACSGRKTTKRKKRRSTIFCLNSATASRTACSMSPSTATKSEHYHAVYANNILDRWTIKCMSALAFTRYNLTPLCGQCSVYEEEESIIIWMSRFWCVYSRRKWQFRTDPVQVPLGDVECPIHSKQDKQHRQGDTRAGK